MRRRTASVFVSVLTVCALLSGIPGAAAQDTRQPPVQKPPAFRATIALVPIDVTVTNRDGNPVLDLKQEDFTVLEDGVPQQIRHFSLERLAGEIPAADAARPVLRPVSALELSPQNRRVFVVALSAWRGTHLQYPSKGLEALLQFVRQRLLPQDQIAVMAYNRATDFTTEHDRIAQVIERFQAKSEKIGALLEQWFSGLRAIYGSGKIPDFIQREIDAIFDVAGGAARQIPASDATRRAGAIPPVLAPAPPSLAAASDAGVSSPPDASLEDLKNAEVKFNEYVSKSLQTMQGVSQIFAGVQYMRHLDGQKHLVFMGGSLYLPRLEDDISLAAMANDARVAIDMIQTEGIPGPVMREGRLTGESDLGGIAANQTLRTIADHTGGQAFIASYAKPAFDRIDAVTRAQYLLGYYPANPNWNGKYRRIQVKVNRPGATVSFRQGYYARQTVAPYDRKAFLAYTRIASAGWSDKEVHDLKLRAETSTAAGKDGVRQTTMAVSIDASRIRFENVDGRHCASLQIAVFYGDDKGRSINDMWQPMSLKLKEETYAKYLVTGIPYSFQIPVKLRPKFVKIIVYNYESDIVGSIEKQLR
jgi:VWFA-related protein